MDRQIRPLRVLAEAILLIGGAAVQSAATPPPPSVLQDPHMAQPWLSLSAAEMLDWAEAMERRQRRDLAMRVYRLLVEDPGLEVRSEARFRLAMMLVNDARLPDAARLLRQILDEQPRAQRVRLELARLLDRLGDEAGARRALREAQAGGLPDDVARFVERYVAGLRARKPFGATLHVAIAPDSNISRATRSDTLETVIGDFSLDEDARERSGVGAALGGEAYARLRVGDGVNLLGRVSASADIYRRSAFNDFTLAVSAGPEIQLGRSRLTSEAGVSLRWLGNRSYSRTTSLAFNLFRPLDPQSQVRLAAKLGKIDHARNPLQSGRSYTFSITYERALSSRTGVGATAAGAREALRDAGFSNTAGQLTLFGYRDLGPMTLIATLGHGRLESDERLFIYPRRRSDRFYRASLAATFRQLAFGQFAPFARLTVERNRSSIELYDYRRLRTEFGLARAF